MARLAERPGGGGGGVAAGGGTAAGSGSAEETATGLVLAWSAASPLDERPHRGFTHLYGVRLKVRSKRAFRHNRNCNPGGAGKGRNQLAGTEAAHPEGRSGSFLRFLYVFW